MKINIAGGRGIMGQVHKPIFEKAGHEVLISGRKTVPNLEQASQESDITIVSVPIHATREIIQRVAPYCKAIMDFTSVKTRPIQAMLQYSSADCEVAGLHPLYGNVDSIKGRTIIYCKKTRTGQRCEEVVKALESQGAIIREMTPENHDFYVTGLSQNARAILLETYGLLLERFGISAEGLRELSSPPTRILLDLLARQSKPENDAMYKAMRDSNPQQKLINNTIRDCLKQALTDSKTPEKIRKSFLQLTKAQQRAQNLIDIAD